MIAQIFCVGKCTHKKQTHTYSTCHYDMVAYIVRRATCADASLSLDHLSHRAFSLVLPPRYTPAKHGWFAASRSGIPLFAFQISPNPSVVGLAHLDQSSIAWGIANLDLSMTWDCAYLGTSFTVFLLYLILTYLWL